MPVVFHKTPLAGVVLGGLLAACPSARPPATSDGGEDAGFAGCTIGGAAYLPGAYNPNQPCQTCQPVASTSAFSNFTGLPPDGVCNAGEVCNAGACQGGCFVADAGFIAPNALSATGGCVSCQPSVSTSGWKPVADNTGCAGSGFCESGSCEAGCLVGSTFYSSGQSAQGNACAVCDPTGQGGTQGFSPVSTIVACAFDGGDYCSTQGAGQCVQACVVAGKEYYPSAPDPTNPCLSCQPQDSSTSFTDEPQGFGCGPAGSYCNAGSCGVYCDIGGTLVPDAGLDPQNPNQCCNIPLSSTNWSLGFGTQITTPNTTATPTALAIGDVTGDGKPDLVVAETGIANLIEIFAGNGDGTFAPPNQLAAPNPVALALADFNNDGHLDIAVANNGGNSVTVLLNQTDGGFAATTISNVKKPTALIVADLQAPGSRDLVVGALSSTIQNPPEVVALVNQGLSGSFAIGPSAPLTEAVVALAVASFSNVAGEVDVAAIGSKNLTIIANASKGAGLSAGTPTAFATATLAGIATGDLNGDNRPDLAVIDQANNQVISLLNAGSSFAPQTALSVTSPTAVAIADLNGDKIPDIAVATGSGSVQVFLNQTKPGATSTSFFTTTPGSYPVATQPAALAADDVNADNVPDLVTASKVKKTASVLLGQCP